MAVKNNKRRAIPNSVLRKFENEIKDMRKRCPICWNPLFGECHIGHVKPVSKFGDQEKVRRFVGICQYCNTSSGAVEVELSLVDMTKIIYDEYGTP